MIGTKKILGIIPARFASSRFPGKPLADIAGKSMIQRVYEQSMKARMPDNIVVATDDTRIFQHVLSFGGNAVTTLSSHRSGTERCAEIASLDKFADFDIVINIQGDEPLIDPDQIDALASLFVHKDALIATLVRPVSDTSDMLNPNIVKAVISKKNKALYFSRSPIPFVRGEKGKTAPQNIPFYHHIGIYGFTRDTLLKIAQLEPTPCETAESLEQLRWLENGYAIITGVSSHVSYSVDTPGDLYKINELIARDNLA